MILLDHNNKQTKLILLIITLNCIAMAFLATAPSTASIHSTNHHQLMSPQSMAYFNPETGQFTTQPMPILEENPSLQTQSLSAQSLQAKAALIAPQRQSTYQQEVSNPASEGSQAYTHYNNSFVIPAPRSLHSHLVAHLSSQADIEKGAQLITYKHEGLDIHQSEKPSL